MDDEQSITIGLFIMNFLYIYDSKFDGILHVKFMYS